MRLRCKPRFVGAFVLGLALYLPLVRAQYTANFQTNIISGVTSNWPGGYIIGNANFSDVLLIENGGVLLSMSNGGIAMDSSNNALLITGTGSVWSNGESMIIGYYLPGNSVVVSNGGQVVSAVNLQANTVFGDSGSSSNNSALVTGAGSVWNSYGGFGIGSLGNGNRFVVNNGGKVISKSCDLGDSANNGVLVSDPGSVWSNSGPFMVGRYGAGNSLVISNGGQLVDDSGYLNNESNSALVIGSGSVWNNSENLGCSGSSNQLTVADSSLVIASGASLDSTPGSIANQIRVTGGSLYVTNASHNAVFDVVCGQLVLNAGLLQVDTLVITNPCAQFIHTGGTFVISNVVLDPNLFRITSITPQSNDMLITWMMAPGASNTLQVTTGDASGNYSSNGFTDIFVVTNNPSLGTVTNYLDRGAATNGTTRYYRARFIP